MPRHAATRKIISQGKQSLRELSSEAFRPLESGFGLDQSEIS